MSSLWIRVSYSVLLALVVALTAAFAATMVITGPRPPDTPSLTFRQLQSESDNPQQTDELIGTVDRFFQDSYDFRRAYPDYQRDILLAAVSLATIIGAAGIVLTPSLNYLRFGLTLGASLLLVWGAAAVLAPVPNPAPSDSSTVTNLLAAGMPAGLDFAGRFLRFAVSFVALLVFLFLGLWRLTEWPAFAQRAASDATTSGDPPLPSAPGAPRTGGADAVAYTPGGERPLWQRPDDR